MTDVTSPTRPAMAQRLPDIEAVAERVHDAWCASKREGGISSRLSETGEELMRPYDQLSEAAKALDRATVQAVYDAIAAATADAPAASTLAPHDAQAAAQPESAAGEEDPGVAIEELVNADVNDRNEGRPGGVATDRRGA